MQCRKEQCQNIEPTTKTGKPGVIRKKPGIFWGYWKGFLTLHREGTWAEVNLIETRKPCSYRDSKAHQWQNWKGKTTPENLSHSHGLLCERFSSCQADRSVCSTQGTSFLRGERRALHSAQPNEAAPRGPNCFQLTALHPRKKWIFVEFKITVNQ